MIKIGITGGIGSGKSVVAELLRLSNIPIYNADIESKKLMNTSACIKEKLSCLFGTDIYTCKGLNKPLLASYIFNDNLLLAKVNDIVHPEVKSDFNNWASKQHLYCGIESAILFESEFDKTVDLTLMVYAPETIRIERAINRDKTDRDSIIRRIKNQMADEEKAALCNYIIYNDNRQALIPQITSFIKTLKSKKILL